MTTITKKYPSYFSIEHLPEWLGNQMVLLHLSRCAAIYVCAAFHFLFSYFLYRGSYRIRTYACPIYEIGALTNLAKDPFYYPEGRVGFEPTNYAFAERIFRPLRHLPLFHFHRAEDWPRTSHLYFGKVMFYQLNYSRKLGFLS